MKDQSKYEEWLSCIANTRLLFNTITELEDFLETPSIHSNGIKRCFTSHQRLRSAFRDLYCETEEMTGGDINLQSLLIHYKRAWRFYKNHLDRRSDPFAVALELLRFHYPPYTINNIGRKKSAIFEEIEEKGISIPFLVLFLLKVFPGYDSKNGDVTNMEEMFDITLQLLSKFTEGSGLYSKLPVIIEAQEEPQKTRLSLYFHVSQILHTYESFAEQSSIYETSTEIKNRKVDLDLAGYWNEYDGELKNTDFWQIEETKDEGTYFATFWQKDAGNNLTGIRYALFVVEGADGSLIAYLQHPEAIKNRMKGKAYTDKDHVWYTANFPHSNAPQELFFDRLMASSTWKQNLNLTRITDEKPLEICKNWFKTCTIQKPFGHLEYTFIPSIFAITQDAIYIRAEEEEGYYKIPKASFEGFENIQIHDNIGLLRMENKTYFAFDEFLLYLPVNSSTMKKYGITKVGHVE